MNSFDSFLKLHHDTVPMILGNAWDVTTAKVLEQSGSKAIGTSSWAVAQSFGYDDGENISFDVLLQLAKRIIKSISVPFTVDLEGGYSRKSIEIAENIEKLHDIGVVGINIEDSVKHQLLLVKDFQKTLSIVADHLIRKNIKVFINTRTDAFLMNHASALEETIKRIKAYENHGANGIFVPYLLDKKDIRCVVESTKLPVNVMCHPNLPAFSALSDLGVKRISMGVGFFKAVNSAMKKMLDGFNAEQACQILYR
jgi:2-methylisocitrate lyase-like PEP mutase family enzyme